jgi:hypothetical protein
MFFEIELAAPLTATFCSYALGFRFMLVLMEFEAPLTAADA